MTKRPAVARKFVPARKRKNKKAAKVVVSQRQRRQSVASVGNSSRTSSPPPLVFDERYREYIIPTEDDALIRFPIEMGSGVILITRHVDETLSIKLPPHCPGIEVKIRGEDGSQSDPEIHYTRKTFA